MSGINLQQYSMNPSAQSPSSSVDPSPLLIEDYGDMTHRDGGDGTKGTTPSRVDDPDDVVVPADDDPPSRNEPAWRRPHAYAKSYLDDLSQHFPTKFLMWLGINNTFITGGAYTLVMAMSLPLFKGLGIGASRQQLYVSMISAPWAMKPFIGVASDLFPIGGYNKRYFAFFAILVGLVGCSTLLGLSTSTDVAREEGPDAIQTLIDWIVLCFTAVSYEAATLDILGEGKYAELMRESSYQFSIFHHLSMKKISSRTGLVKMSAICSSVWHYSISFKSRPPSTVRFVDNILQVRDEPIG